MIIFDLIRTGLRTYVAFNSCWTYEVVNLVMTRRVLLSYSKVGAFSVKQQS